MDAPIALALMAKARRVFEHNSTFLSFPVTGQIAYGPDDLDFLSGEVSTNVEQLRQSEFCRMVNLIPQGPVWPPGEEHYLWNVYEDVMKANVEFAVSTRTPDEEEEYREAFHLLYDVDKDGLRRDSQMVQAYNQYRDAWFTAKEDYNNSKIEAEFTEDPKTKAQWEQVTEPRLASEIDSIENEWRVKGFRDQVEEARRTEQALGSKSPLSTWQNWDKLFDRNVDILTDTANQHYVLSGITPSNALESTDWLKFTLTGAEAEKLISEAPAELKDRLSPDPVDIDIDSVSFEYTSAAVSRPWLASDMFKARFWKFNNPDTLVSDGQTPASGLIPAYVAALVFARHPVVTLRENSERNRMMLKRIPAAKSLSLGMFNVAPVSGKTVMTAAMPAAVNTAAPKSTLQPDQQARIKAALGRLSVGNFSRLAAGPAVRTTRTIAARPAVRDHRATATTIVRDHRTGRNVTVRDHRTTRVPARPPASGTAGSTSTGPAGSTPESRPPDDSIYLLAFICKKLPKCPDPDPGFQW